MKKPLVALAALLLLAFAFFIWPTPYVRWLNDASMESRRAGGAQYRVTQYRENRITGTVEIRLIGKPKGSGLKISDWHPIPSTDD